MVTAYKFCGKYGLDILRNLELKVTPPNQFNDPFEFTPRIDYSDPVGYAERYLQHEDILKWLYDSQSSQGKFHDSFQKFQQLANERQREMVEAFVRVLPLGAAQVERGFLDEVSKRMGVLCMSGRRDSILMWGHYCDKPIGLVIGFDKSSAIFQQGKGLRSVDYVTERVVFDPCWEVGSPEMENYEYRIVLSKSDAWNYEKELRQLFWLSSLKQRKLNDGTLGHFLQFPPETIVSVTLGPRCSPKLEGDVQDILRKSCFSNVTVDHAVLHKNNYIIEFQ